MIIEVAPDTNIGYLVMKRLVLAFFALMTLTGCNDLRIGVGLKGIMLNDDKITLDGDTFDIREKIGDSLLIVWNYEHPEDNIPYYLLKYERNGFYYPQLAAARMSSIDNTVNYVSVDDKNVYDIKEKKVLFSAPCDISMLSYLGKWKNLLVFASPDTICFSDGKCVGLQYDVFCRKPKNNGKVTLIAGAQTIEVSFGDLYHAKKIGKTSDPSVEKINKSYYIKPRNKYETMRAGFSVELDAPKDNSEQDKTVREWMMKAVRDDAFFQLENNRDIPVGKCTSLEDMRHSLDEYGVLWEKLCRAEYQVEDTFEVKMTCDVVVRKMVDCDDYTTYHYWASLYGGGLHDLPHEYYITYDKRRGKLLDVDNSVKPAMNQQFRHLVLESLKKEYDYHYECESSWKDFTNYVFSFHCPVIDTGGVDDVMRSFLVHDYSCDVWAGWDGYYDKSFTEKDFPLTHFAVLPDGIVLTYHPYQIDCFAAGEYHAVIPFKDANKCLMFDYSKHEDLKPTLQRFIK